MPAIAAWQTDLQPSLPSHNIPVCVSLGCAIFTRPVYFPDELLFSRFDLNRKDGLVKNFGPTQMERIDLTNRLPTNPVRTGAKREFPFVRRPQRNRFFAAVLPIFCRVFSNFLPRHSGWIWRRFPCFGGVFRNLDLRGCAETTSDRWFCDLEPTGPGGSLSQICVQNVDFVQVFSWPATSGVLDFHETRLLPQNHVF